jgi:phosphoribosyl-AMP cyclohydrolase
MGDQKKDPLNEGLELTVQFDKRGGKIPVVLRNYLNGVVFGLDYVGKEAWQEALRTMKWTSGTEQAQARSFDIGGILVDCDQDAAVCNLTNAVQSNLRDLMDPGVVKYDDKGLVPVITQEIGTNRVLMLAYAKKESLEKTNEIGKATFWSTSRGKEWVKGETSGDYLVLKRMLVHPEGEFVLYFVEMAGSGACHTGRKSCFYRRVIDGGKLEFLPEME